MKRVAMFTFFLAFGLSLQAQTQPGTIQLSLSGNVGFVSGSSETTTPYGSFSSTMESQGFIAVMLRPGVYATSALVIEPEIFFTSAERQLPAYSISGNLAYNFPIADSHITPFVLAGYGIGNGVPAFERLIFRSSDKLDIPVLNAGAGVHVFITDRVAFRAEYRYQRYTQDQSTGGTIYYSTKSTYRYHNIFFGFSVLFPR